MKYRLIALILIIFVLFMSDIEAKQLVSAGFIQFYNDDLINTTKTLNDSKMNNIDLIILQFTKWDNVTVNYDKNKILEWSKTNDSKILIGLTGRGSKVNGLDRDHTTYWKNKVDNIKITNLIEEDMEIVTDWPRNNKVIIGFYSSYEPLSTMYVRDVGIEYDEYLLGLSNKLEDWAKTNNRDIILAFSGAVAYHSAHSEYARRVIKDKAKIFSERILKIAKKVLANKNRVKLVFILQDGAGERKVSNDQLAVKVKPFFVEVKKELKTINNIKFWPLIEAFDRVGAVRKHTSKDSLKRRWENISDLGWNSGIEDKYRIVVFDLPSFNKTMGGY
ncbi:hypothetical protein QUF90_24255 [Desulfococcaceae bacterium HSG9]|nr:hypothetical protein [Desulfococcaceae bacterium HSG9]